MNVNLKTLTPVSVLFAEVSAGECLLYIVRPLVGGNLYSVRSLDGFAFVFVASLRIREYIQRRF